MFIDWDVSIKWYFVVSSFLMYWSYNPENR